MGRKFHTARQQPGLETELERIKIRLAEVEKALWGRTFENDYTSIRPRRIRTNDVELVVVDDAEPAKKKCKS